MQFVCRVGTPDGRVLEDTFVASDEPALFADLAKRGYHVFEVRRRGIPRKLSLTAPGRRRRRISSAEFLVFNQELAALLKAGLPLLQGLQLMLERMRNQQFKAVLGDIYDRVESGEDLSEAFSAHAELFPRLYPSSLKAGERSGEIEKVIRRFIRYMKLVIEARKKVVSALIYPAVLICLSITMIIIMMVFVVPKFLVFFEQMETELPPLTRFVLGVSAFARGHVVLLAAAIATLVVVFRSWSRSAQGHLTLDRLKLRLPFLGPVLHRFAMAEFCRSLATLLAGGIPLVPAFEIAASAVGNAHMRQRIEPTIQSVREGRPFYAAVEDSGMFTDMAIDMIKVGESTGALDEMLGSVSDFLDEQIETRMQRLLSLVEPLMLVFMGVIVATILISIYLPLFRVLGESKF